MECLDVNGAAWQRYTKSYNKELMDTMIPGTTTFVKRKEESGGILLWNLTLPNKTLAILYNIVFVAVVTQQQVLSFHFSRSNFVVKRKTYRGINK